MKRPHRRIHILMWLILFPLTLAAGIWIWQQRPAPPYDSLPPSINTLTTESQ